VERVTHLLLTRFNVRWIVEPHDTAWLEHRFALFDRFCFPSVRAQTSTAFRWLVFFDEDTPEPFRSRIEEYAEWPAFVPAFVGRPSASVFDDAVAAHLDGASHLVTTRLDNDDAISRDFVDRVQHHVRPGAREFLNLPVGCVWRAGRVYRHEHPSNAFISLAEPADGFVTVWHARHEDAADLAPVRQIEGGPAWLQVIHEHNVSNRVRGLRMRGDDVRDLFPVDLGGDGDGDSDVRMWVDRRLRHPSRMARDRALRLAKPVRDAVERVTTPVRDR